jgi:hypothetical protein
MITELNEREPRDGEKVPYKLDQFEIIRIG